MTGIIGPHITGGAERHRDVLAEWQPRLTVLLDPEAKDVTALPANTITVGRIYVPDSEMESRIRANPEDAAQFAHDKIRASSAFGHVDYFVVENEILQQWDGLPFLNRYMVRRMELANAAGYKCGIGASSNGNFDMPEHDRLALYRQVFDALRMAEAGGHIWLVHGYGWPTLWEPKDRGAPDWMVHRLEHELLPRLKPLFPNLRYAMTEIGVDKLIINEVGGWQVSGLSAEQYALDLYHIGQYLEKFSTDVLGYAVFTLGHNAPWETYDIQGEVANRLAALYKEERKSGGTMPGQSRWIDVSHHQGTINWAQVKGSGIEGAFVRMADGTIGRDTQYVANIIGADGQGILVGIYYFWYDHLSIDAQYNLIKEGLGTRIPSVLVIDVEDASYRANITNAQRSDRLADLLKKLQADKYRLAIYTSRAMWDGHFVRSTWWKQFYLWVADWRQVSSPALPADWTEWEWWQTSSTGRVAGINGNVDMDAGRRTITQYRELFRDEVQPPPPSNLEKRVAALEQKLTALTAHFKNVPA